MFEPPVYDQTYELPFGFSVHFASNADGIDTRWTPTQPDDEWYDNCDTPCAEELMREAYYEASRDFAMTLATMAGATVYMLPLGDGDAVQAKPQRKH
jgi:hypothetical protein